MTAAACRSRRGILQSQRYGGSAGYQLSAEALARAALQASPAGVRDGGARGPDHAGPSAGHPAGPRQRLGPTPTPTCSTPTTWRSAIRPLRLGRLELANRIIVSLMDMYSARDGVPGDFHLVHLGGKALGENARAFAEHGAADSGRAQGGRAEDQRPRLDPFRAGVPRTAHARWRPAAAR